MNKYLEIKDFRFSFKSNFSLLIKQFNVSQGKILFINGPSGSGKTTLFNLILNILESNIGSFLDSNFTAIDYIPHETNLLPFYNIQKNLYVEGKLKEKTVNEISYKKYTKLFNVSGIDDYYPRQLSLGMKQRIQLAKALSFEPDLLLLDEAISGIDGNNKTIIFSEITKYTKLYNSSIILTSHNMLDQIYIADRIYYVNDGIIENYDDIDIPSEERLLMDLPTLLEIPIIKYIVEKNNYM